MEITIEKSLLQDVFSRVARVVEQKSISPIAGTVKIHVGDDGLFFTAKGNEVFVQAIIDNNDFKVESEDTCSICVPANLFVQLLPKLPQYLNGAIKMVVSPKVHGDYILAITPPDGMDKNAKYQLDVLDGSSFFELPDINEKNKIDISSDQLLEIINKVPFAAASEQYVVIFLGIKFFTEGDSLITVATDAHRLVELSLDFDQVPQEPIDFVCYANGVNDLKNVFNFGDNSSNVSVSYGDSHVRFKQENKIVYIRLIDGDFPVYKSDDETSVVPRNFASQLEVDASELLEYIKPASLLTNAILIMSFSEDGVTIKSESDKGSSVDVVEDIKWIKGDPINRVMFSSAYLNEQLSKFEGRRITLNLVGEDQAMVISDEGYFHFLSCVTIKSEEDDED